MHLFMITSENTLMFIFCILDYHILVHVNLVNTVLRFYAFMISYQFFSRTQDLVNIYQLWLVVIVFIVMI